MESNIEAEEHLKAQVRVHSRKTKQVISCAIWFCTFSFGLAYNFLSPALVEIKNKYNVDIDEISDVFTIILLCYLVGALTCGVLFDYVNRQLIVVGLMSVMAIGVFAIPYCPTITIFFAVGGMIGFVAGGYDCAQVVWILEMWQGEAGRYVQSQYFFFALGNLAAPLLLRPFLIEEDIFNDKTTTTTTTVAPGNSTAAKSELYIPLSIGGSVIVLSACVMLFLYFYNKYEQPMKKAVDETVITPTSVPEVVPEVNPDIIETEKSRPTKRLDWKRWDWSKIILIALSAVVLGCYQGMEISTFQFLPTFTHYVKLRLSEREGASVLSSFTGAFTAGRLLGIFISIYKVRPTLVLVANLVMSVAGNVILLIYADKNETLLWVGAILLGLGYSTVFACIYDHIEKHLRVTNIVAATFVVAGGLVSALYPLIVGGQVELHPSVLNYTIFFSLVMCTVSFSFIYWITVIKKKSTRTETDMSSLGAAYLANTIF